MILPTSVERRIVDFYWNANAGIGRDFLRRAVVKGGSGSEIIIRKTLKRPSVNSGRHFRKTLKSSEVDHEHILKK